MYTIPKEHSRCLVAPMFQPPSVAGLQRRDPYWVLPVWMEPSALSRPPLLSRALPRPEEGFPVWGVWESRFISRCTVCSTAAVVNLVGNKQPFTVVLWRRKESE